MAAAYQRQQRRNQHLGISMQRGGGGGIRRKKKYQRRRNGMTYQQQALAKIWRRGGNKRRHGEYRGGNKRSENGKMAHVVA